MGIPSINGQVLLHRLLQNKLIGIFMYDRDLKICEWNSYMESLTGFRRKDCLGKQIVEVVQTTSPELDKKVFRQVLKGEQGILKNRPLMVRNGETTLKTFNFLCMPLDEADDNIPFGVVMATEVEEENIKREMEQQKAALRSLRSFLKFAPMPIFIIDRSLRVQLANEAFNQYFGVRNATGQLLEELLSPQARASEMMQEQKEIISQVIKSGIPKASYVSFPYKQQELHLFLIRFPIKNSQGKVDAVGGYALDVTEKVEQEQKIQQLLADATALNEELETQNEALTENRKHLEAANTRLRQKKKKLKAALEELSQRNHELDQIIYKTSHDLRSPLTSILGLISLAREEENAEKLPEYFEFMENRVSKLDTFVKSMLSYAKTSRMELKPVEIDWGELINECLGNLEYMANYRHIRICVEYNSNKDTFQSDLLRLKVIFNNLLGNAIKYADLQKEDPFIHIQVETAAGEARIRIQDNGIGIEKKYLPEIGKMFFRATEKSEGSGLGMYIVKQAIEKLGGEMEIESEPRLGTLISINLPSLH